jgi:UDP-glucose 4-epimerase
MVLPNFVQQALAGDAVTVFGTGEQARCFGHVADVIEGVIACVSVAATHGEVFNLGNPEEISINGLAKKVVEMTGSSSPIKHIPYTEAYGPGFEDMDRRVPDITKARRAFGFEPKRKLEEIIQSVINHERPKAAKLAQMSSQ